MIHNLQDGDQILFLKNLLEDGTYGGNIFVQERYWLKEQQTCLVDDPNMQIFPYLKEIHWNMRSGVSSNQRTICPISSATAYYTYVLVNGEYRIIKFGRQIYDMINEFIKTHNHYPHRVFRVNIKNSRGFTNPDDSFFTNTIIEQPTEQFLSTKSVYLENIGKNFIWTRDKNYDLLMDFFHKNNIDIKPIQVLKTKQREKKLERIMKNELKELL